MRFALLPALVLTLAACSADETVAPKHAETPAQFAMRITTLLRDGEFAAAWLDLHPEHKKFVTRTTLAECWTQTADVLNNPDVELEVVGVADEDWEIPGTSLIRPSKAITVQAVVPAATGGDRVLEMWTQHAFDTGTDGWAWILAPALLNDARTEVC